MSLYTEWRNLSDNHESQEAEVKFWEAYLQAEASIYNELLNNKQEVIEGKVSELAAKYNGGGHIYSSGARVKTKEELNNLIVDYDDLCKDYLKNN